MMEENYCGYKEKEEIPVDTAWTNWIYIPKTMHMDCETGGGKNISDGGIAFLLATRYGQRLGAYRDDPLQHAVWSWLGQGEDPGKLGDLKDVADAYDVYHKASKEPNVDVEPSSSVGSVSSGNGYTIGPFKMSAYVTAKAGEYASEGSAGSASKDLQSIMGDNYKAGIIEAKAILANGSGGTKEVTISIPKRDSNFYINLTESEVSGYDELLEITFLYQRIHACASGTLYEGHQKGVVYKEKSGSVTTGCTWYYCTGCYCSGGHKMLSCHKCYCTDHYCNTICTTDEHTHTEAGKCYNLKGTLICTKKAHTHGYNCYDDCDCNGHRYKDGGECPDKGYCDCSGHIQGTIMYGKQVRCIHDHLDCKRFEWTDPPTEGGDECQDGLAANGILVKEQIKYTIRVEVPIKTDISIYKYINKVEHLGETVTTYSSNSRRSMSMGAKLNDPVKIERGDLVTYQIELVNNSRFPAQVQVKDLLPEKCITTTDTRAYVPQEILFSKWITINAYSTRKFEIKVIPIADSGKYTNIIEIINHPNVRYLTWGYTATHGTHSSGSMVNTSNRVIDSDTYVIKEYYVSIKKYIYDVQHTGPLNTTNTTFAASYNRENLTETNKSEKPVYVEYGDRITYKIEIYNTTKPDVDRKKAPYYEPDKVYVNITDELPKKYSNVGYMIENSANNSKIPVRSRINFGKLYLEDLCVPAGDSVTITITLIAEEHGKGIIETNTANLTNQIRNINYKSAPSGYNDDERCIIKNNANRDKLVSKDYYKLNDYNVSVNKYIEKVESTITEINNQKELTNESYILDEIENRKTYSEQEKRENPVSVEKTDRIVYAIKINNDAVNSDGNREVYTDISSGKKQATQVRPSIIEDYLQKGLEYKSLEAIIYDGKTGKPSTKNNDINGTIGEASITANYKETIEENGIEYNIYELVLGDEYILDPGDYIICYLTVEVTQSNMYLYSLENKMDLAVLTNINNKTENLNNSNTRKFTKIVKNEKYNENISPVQTSSDFVKLKDLVLSGTVWLDEDKDGWIGREGSYSIEGFIEADKEHSSNIMHSGDYPELAMKGIVVKLYEDVGRDGNDENDGEPIRITKTDEKGQYTFAEFINSEGKLEFYPGIYQSKRNENGEIETTDSKQRIDKADNKDSNGNYQENSQYREYYIEYEYDGLVYKSTELYAGKENLNDDGSFVDEDGTKKYIFDSNAAEFKKEREEFNKKYEIITYNKAININNEEAHRLGFEKDGHYSYLKNDPERIMTSRSFIIKNENPNEEKTDYLFLYPFESKTNYSTTPETEYLKHINLGLEEREDVDISLIKDVYEVKTTINGEEMTYKYDQIAEASSKLSNMQILNGEMSENEKYLNNYVQNESYKMPLYESDFKYRYEQYANAEVRNYKGKESELNVEVTYKITVSSKKIAEDEKVTNDRQDMRDVKLTTKIHEILDVYDEKFMKYSNNANNITVKTKDENNQLVNKELQIAEAWCYAENGTIKVPLQISNTSKYLVTETNEIQEIEKNNSFDGYNTLYISGMENAEIKEGENLDIYVKYVLDKENKEETDENKDRRELKLGEDTNIAQVNAYSVWYEDKKPASIVDCDSNAGNLGIKEDGGKDFRIDTIEHVKYYEDTVYRTKVDINVEDNSEDSENQEEINNIRKISGKVWDDTRSEVEESSNQYYGNGIYSETEEKYENAKMNDNVSRNYKTPDVTEQKDIAVRSAKVEYIEIVEIGTGENKKYYEEKLSNVTWNAIQNTRTNEDGTYTLSGYIPGYYIVRYTYGDTVSETFDETNEVQKDMLIFNGQDYKSTKYTGVSDEVTDYDEILLKMQEENNSDARDDEIKRLETIAYSETMSNYKAEILKGVANGTVTDDEKNSNTQLKLLTSNTYMYADTVKFYVKPEKIDDLMGEYTFKYTDLEELIYHDVLTRKFNIKNIDFGIEYRPETQISLYKEITGVTLTTSNGDVKVKLALETKNMGEGESQYHVIKEDSIGIEYTQFISNDYKTIEPYKLTSEDYQGFIFVNVDDDVLQGASIEIEYSFILENNSETDRISELLDNLKEKSKVADENKLAYVRLDGNSKLYTPEEIDNTDDMYMYSAAGTARNILAEEYGLYNVNGSKYMTKERKSGDYYGKYLGTFYYNGESDTDAISSIRFDKVLDYLDIDLVYRADTNDSKTNTKWSQVTDEDLLNIYVKGESFSELNGNKRLLNTEGIGYVSYEEKQGTNNQTDKKVITSNLLVSVGDIAKETNKGVSRFLKPYDIKNEANEIVEENSATIRLIGSKIISTESDTNEMEYENIAEVIQITSQTGRRTNYATTIGNVDIRKGEFDEAEKESDTSATEVVTLIPPTGLDRLNRIIRDTVETTGIGIGVFIIIAALVVGGIVIAKFIIKKIRKRAIK